LRQRDMGKREPRAKNAKAQETFLTRSREKREEKTREAKEIRVKLGQWGFLQLSIFRNLA